MFRLFSTSIKRSREHTWEKRTFLKIRKKCPPALRSLFLKTVCYLFIPFWTTCNSIFHRSKISRSYKEVERTHCWCARSIVSRFESMAFLREKRPCDFILFRIVLKHARSSGNVSEFLGKRTRPMLAHSRIEPRKITFQKQIWIVLEAARGAPVSLERKHEG